MYFQVYDALDLAFKELDSEDSFDSSNKTNNNESKTKRGPKAKNANTEGNIKGAIAPLYENIEVFYQNEGPTDASAFPLDLPTNVLEPPKEKPPPPPIEEDADNDELLGNVSLTII